MPFFVINHSRKESSTLGLVMTTESLPKTRLISLSVSITGSTSLKCCQGLMKTRKTSDNYSRVN